MTDEPAEDAFLQDLIEALPAPAFVCDPEGRLLHFNTSAAALWGRQPDATARWTGALRLRSPFDGKPIPPEEASAARATRLKQEQAMELLVDRPDGSHITVLSRSNTIKHPKGHILGVITILTDVTAQRVAEISQARLAAIVSSSDDAIISKTLEGKILSWNDGARRLFGYTEEETVGKHITIIIPPDMQDEERDILSRLVRGERIDHYETTRMRKDGERLDVSLTSSPVRDSYGNIVGASKIARDVTDKKRKEAHLDALHEELRQANHAKDRFLATLAHELRNPLAPLSHLVQMLQLPDADPQEFHKWLAVIDRQLALMTRLIDDLMDLSRITRNKFELRSDSVSLSEILEAAVETSKPLFRTHGHHFTAQVPAEPVMLHADGVRLIQALTNLLNNAARYTPRGGNIRLSASVKDGQAIIAVEDTGVGVPMEMQDQIFEMFVQAPAGPGRSEGGLGVGLHLARSLAEMHGGTLTVKSEGEGKGSTFLLSIPTSNTESQLEPSVALLSRSRAGGRLVLVTDDNRDAADSLCALLILLGCDAQAAYSGEHALEVGAEMHPEIVLLDVGMPGIDGYETARRMRATPWGAEAHLYAVTGWGERSVRDRAKEAGFDDHFVKPLKMDALQSLLQVAAAR